MHFYAQGLDAGLVGLGLAYSVSVTGMAQYVVRTSAEIENVVQFMINRYKLLYQ